MTRQTSGWFNGFFAVLIFSGSLPATRAALAGFDPVFLTAARAVIAALLAAAVLLMTKAPRPHRSDLCSLGLIGVGAVVGFPLLSSLALQHVTSAHAMIFIGLLPLSTAVFGAVRGGERPTPVFWLFALLGAGVVAGYALHFGSVASWVGDGLMLLAILVCGLAYAEGGKLSRRLGGMRVICWALVLAFPVMAPFLFTSSPDLPRVPGSAWFGLSYISVFSMLVGFVFWYRGLARGGIAAVGQLQLLQPFFGLMLCAGLLHEPVDSRLILAAALAAVCVGMAKHYSNRPRNRLSKPPGDFAPKPASSPNAV